MTAIRKFQVFVSATFDDLVKEREEVFFAVLRAKQIPVGMELFSAADDRGWGVIKRVIDESDYYVIVVAGRYGSIDKSTGISWTEREYNYAREKGIKVLAFIREDASISLDKTDSQPDKTAKQELLAKFKETLRDAHLCATWKTGEDLARKVGDALRNTIQDDEDAGTLPPGYTRGASAQASSVVSPAAVVASRELSVGPVILREGVENEVDGHWSPAAIANNIDVQGAFVGFRLGVTNPATLSDPATGYIGVCVKREGWGELVRTTSPGVVIDQAVGPEGNMENKLKIDLDAVPSLRRDYLFHFGPQLSRDQTGTFERDGVRCIVHQYTRQGKRRFSLLVRPKGLLNAGTGELRWSS